MVNYPTYNEKPTYWLLVKCMN